MNSIQSHKIDQGSENSAIADIRGFSRLFIIILMIGGIGIAGYVPFASAVGLPPTLYALQIGLLLAGALIGTRYAASLDLHLPLIERFLQGKLQIEDAAKSLAPMAGLGILVSLAYVAYQYFITRPLTFAASGVDIFDPTNLPLYIELLGPSLYGEITEEIIFRYGLLTALAIVVTKLVQSSDRISLSSAAVMWTAILIAAIPFALEHLVFLVVPTPCAHCCDAPSNWSP